jgi:hypothetical protein
MMRKLLLATAALLAGIGGGAFAQTTTRPTTPPAATGKPTAPPAATTPSTPPTAAAPTTPPPASAQTAPSYSQTPTGLNQYKTEAEAKGHCPTDTVVWANLGGSKAYHLSGDRYYGKTKKGAYMCMKDADAGGFHKAGTHSGTTTRATTPRKPS